MASSSEKIRELNDRFRAGDTTISGRVMVTAGVQRLVDQAANLDLALVIQAVARFNDFTLDNDPHQEHDFGSFEIHSENTNLYCQIAEVIRHPQRKRESVMPEHSIHQKSVAKTRICIARTQNSF